MITRLVGGVSRIEGRLRICSTFYGSCGNLCYNYFDYIDAGIVCNSLGLGLVLLRPILCNSLFSVHCTFDVCRPACKVGACINIS